MSQDFKDRLARLEAKHGASPPPPDFTKPKAGSGGPLGPRGGKDTGPLKLILAGIFVIVGLPVGAFIGTMLYQQNREVIADLVDGAEFMAIAYAPAINDPERREARRTLDGVAFRLTLGTMSEEEAAYWNSPEGQARLLEDTKRSMDLDGLKAAARKKYQSE